MVVGSRVVAVISAAILGLSSLAWQIKPWEAFEGDEPATVRLTEGHAAAYARNQWNAYLRVLNWTRSSRTPRRFRPRRPESVHGLSEITRQGQDRMSRVAWPNRDNKVVH